MSIFSKIPVPSVPRSPHNLSFNNTLSCRIGDLPPVLVQEVYPADVFRHQHHLFAQFQPINTQLFQNFDVEVRYFFVPTRLLYTDFEEFLVGGRNGQEDFVGPYFTPSQLYSLYGNDFDITGTLFDYMNLPNGIIHAGSAGSPIANKHLSALPFRAYHKIYNDFYRDENLIQEIGGLVTGGNITNAELSSFRYLLRKAWRKDYFTSALPWTQKGDEVTLPLGDKAPLRTDAEFSIAAGTYGKSLTPAKFSPDTASNAQYVTMEEKYSYNGNNIDVNIGGLKTEEWYADLMSATAAPIDRLRVAEMVQEWLERNARGGTRYNEQIFSHFRQRTPDYRLDRSEYIMHVSSPLTFGNVYSTNSNDNVNAQAVPVSTGNCHQVSRRWKYRVREHGYIVGILDVIPRAAYFQGLPRMFQKDTRFDYYWPEFANLGEQAIKNWELYCENYADVDDTFGYTPRYADLKIHLDEIHGDFRTNLKNFHDARIFSQPPTLSQSFIEVNQSNDNLTRIFNNVYSSNDKLMVFLHHKFKSVRPMPYFGVPLFRSGR